MSRELRDRGYYVVGVDPMAREGQNGVHRPYFVGLREFLDRRDYDTYDLVVHCAYEVGGRAHIDGKNLALAHNLEMDALLFDWAVRTEQKAVLYFSSCAAYPEWAQRYPFTLEGDRLNEDLIDEFPSAPADNYGWAKLTGERLAKAASEVGLRVHVVRPFSGYGKTQSLDYPFPSIVRRAREGDLSVWGPPGQTRDWIHVSDVVNGALAVYESDTREAVNLCSGRGTEMGDLAFMIDDAILSRANRISDPVTYMPDKPTGPLYRVGDPTRMNKIYVPKVSLEEGIEEALRG